jgi:hypothetical protein
VARDRPTPEPPTRASGPVRRRLRARPEDVIDVFVYVVVLNLAAEYVPSVISEGFTLSLLTALMLKVVLEGVVWLKSRVLRRLRAADTTASKAIAGEAFWVLAAGNKFIVLKLETCCSVTVSALVASSR